MGWWLLRYTNPLKNPKKSNLLMKLLFRRMVLSRDFSRGEQSIECFEFIYDKSAICSSCRWPITPKYHSPLVDWFRIHVCLISSRCSYDQGSIYINIHFIMDGVG